MSTSTSGEFCLAFVLEVRVLTLAHSAGELNSDELERLVQIIQNPLQFKIPTWFLNRQKDIIDGKNTQVRSSAFIPANSRLI